MSKTEEEVFPKSKIKDLSIIRPENAGEEKLLVRKNYEVAIADLKRDSHFQPANDSDGPYNLKLFIVENKLIFQTENNSGEALPYLILSLKPYRGLIKDYFMIVRSYEQAMRDSMACRVEAIDMGRRALHNEGAELLIERLNGKIELDINTARRLFSLICVLHSGKTHILR